MTTNLLRKRLNERWMDACDWVDYRSDPHWWPYFALAAVLLGAGALYSWQVILLSAALALGVALALTILIVLCLLAWVLARSLADVLLIATRSTLVVPGPRTAAFETEG